MQPTTDMSGGYRDPCHGQITPLCPIHLPAPCSQLQTCREDIAITATGKLPLSVLFISLPHAANYRHVGRISRSLPRANYPSLSYSSPCPMQPTTDMSGGYRDHCHGQITPLCPIHLPAPCSQLQTCQEDITITATGKLPLSVLFISLPHAANYRHVGRISRSLPRANYPSLSYSSPCPIQPTTDMSGGYRDHCHGQITPLCPIHLPAPCSQLQTCREDIAITATGKLPLSVLFISLPHAANYRHVGRISRSLPRANYPSLSYSSPCPMQPTTDMSGGYHDHCHGQITPLCPIHLPAPCSQLQTCREDIAITATGKLPLSVLFVSLPHTANYRHVGRISRSLPRANYPSLSYSSPCPMQPTTDMSGGYHDHCHGQITPLCPIHLPAPCSQLQTCLEDIAITATGKLPLSVLFISLPHAANYRHVGRISRSLPRANYPSLSYSSPCPMQPTTDMSGGYHDPCHGQITPLCPIHLPAPCSQLQTCREDIAITATGKLPLSVLFISLPHAANYRHVGRISRSLPRANYPSLSYSSPCPMQPTADMSGGYHDPCHGQITPLCPIHLPAPCSQLQTCQEDITITATGKLPLSVLFISLPHAANYRHVGRISRSLPRANYPSLSYSSPCPMQPTTDMSGGYRDHCHGQITPLCPIHLPAPCSQLQTCREDIAITATGKLPLSVLFISLPHAANYRHVGRISRSLPRANYPSLSYSSPCPMQPTTDMSGGYHDPCHGQITPLCPIHLPAPCSQLQTCREDIAITATGKLPLSVLFISLPHAANYRHVRRISRSLPRANYPSLSYSSPCPMQPTTDMSGGYRDPCHGQITPLCPIHLPAPCSQLQTCREDITIPATGKLPLSVLFISLPHAANYRHVGRISRSLPRANYPSLSYSSPCPMQPTTDMSGGYHDPCHGQITPLCPIHLPAPCSQLQTCREDITITATGKLPLSVLFISLPHAANYRHVGRISRSLPRANYPSLSYSSPCPMQPTADMSGGYHDPCHGQITPLCPIHLPAPCSQLQTCREDIAITATGKLPLSVLFVSQPHAANYRHVGRISRSLPRANYPSLSYSSPCPMQPTTDMSVGYRDHCHGQITPLCPIHLPAPCSQLQTCREDIAITATGKLPLSVLFISLPHAANCRHVGRISRSLPQANYPSLSYSSPCPMQPTTDMSGGYRDHCHRQITPLCPIHLPAPYTQLQTCQEDIAITATGKLPLHVLFVSLPPCSPLKNIIDSS